MKLKRDAITGIVGIVAVIIFACITLNIRQVPNLIEPGPTMMPFVGLAIIGLSSVMLLIQGLRDQSEEKPFFPAVGKRKLVIAFLILVIYGIALHIFGYIISTPFAMYTFINMLKGDEKVKWWQNLLISISVTAFLYLMFVVGFQIKLPTGLIFK